MFCNMMNLTKARMARRFCKDALAQFDCHIHERVGVGDHIMLVGGIDTRCAIVRKRARRSCISAAIMPVSMSGHVMADVAFIGLGVMGYPMAGHLASAGHRVTVYNRTTEKAEKWVAEHGGKLAATPREAAVNADFIFSCVGNDDDLRAVIAEVMGALVSYGRGRCAD